MLFKAVSIPGAAFSVPFPAERKELILLKKDTAKDFWHKQLLAAVSGRADALIENPSAVFAREAKAGFFDGFSDEEYFDARTETEELASIWDREAKDEAGALIIRALAMTSVDKAHLEALADILSECSENSAYGLLTEEPAAAGPSEGDKPDDASGDPEDLSDFFEKVPVQPQSAASAASVPPDVRAVRRSKRAPKDIYDFLDRRIIGQESAKKAAAMVMYNHLQGRRSTALFCGPTGCGKTEIWRRLAEAFPKRIKIVDSTRLAADGWKGSIHLRDIFEGQPSVGLLKKGLIVVFDEADKMMCENRISSTGMDYSAIVQNDLLKMMDGDVIEFGDEGPGKKAFTVDCSRVSVVMLGAFEDLMKRRTDRPAVMGFNAVNTTEQSFEHADIGIEDLIEAGMRREIAGRLSRIAALDPLGEEQLTGILYACVLPDIAKETGKTVFIDEDSAAVLVKQAAGSALGARSMRSALRNALDNMIFEDPDAENYFIEFCGEEPAA